MFKLRKRPFAISPKPLTESLVAYTVTKHKILAEL